MIDDEVACHSSVKLAAAVESDLCNTARSSIGLCKERSCNNSNQEQLQIDNAALGIHETAGGLQRPDAPHARHGPGVRRVCIR